MIKVESYMNNQNERIKMFVVIFMIAVGILLIFGLTSCASKPLESDDVPETTKSAEESRFVVNDGDNLRGVSNYAIVIDTETGVQYLIVDYRLNSAVMSVLMNPDGTPITTVE